MKKDKGTEENLRPCARLANKNFPELSTELTSAKRLGASQLRQHPRHFQGSLGRLHAAIVFRVEAAHFSLFLVFQEQDFVDHRHTVRDLNLHQRLTYRFADVL